MEMITTNAGLPAVPSYMQDYADKSSMASVNMADYSSEPRIQTKGGMLNCLSGSGEPLGTVAQQDGSVFSYPQHANTLRIIIVDAAPTTANAYRVFYADAFKEGETVPPSCWSADGVAPDTTAANPQSDKCASCAKNVQGSSATGKGKACSSRKRLAVVLADDPTMRVFSLDLPATSIFGTSEREAQGYYRLVNYAKMVRSFNAIWEGVVTEIAFAEGSTKGIQFKAVDWVAPEKLERIMAMKGTPDVEQVLTISYSAKAEDSKTQLLQHPAFKNELAYLSEWAANPDVTEEMIKAAAQNAGITL